MMRPYDDGAARRGRRYLTATRRLTMRLVYLLRPDLSLAKVGAPVGVLAQTVYASTTKKGIGRVKMAAGTGGWDELAGSLRACFEAERTEGEPTWPLGLLLAFQDWRHMNSIDLAGGRQ
jgi:hypothetical protein